MDVFQADDSIIVGNEQFLDMGEEKSKEFLFKASERLRNVTNTFNGVQLSKISNGGIKMSQESEIEDHKTPTTEERFKG